MDPTRFVKKEDMPVIFVGASASFSFAKPRFIYVRRSRLVRTPG